MTLSDQISSLYNDQKTYFNAGKTREISFRISALKRLKAKIKDKEDVICEAIYKDFKKPKFEAIVSETGLIIKELELFITHLKQWSKPKRVSFSLLNFPSSAKIQFEPYGQTLIISPWNYPFQLAVAPLIGAIAAGNTVILKPSELTPHTSNIIAEIITSVFDSGHANVMLGDKDVSQELLSKHWDYVFFTGSVKVGKIVAKACAKNLTPVTLELGGKNPCIVHNSAKVKLTAKRLVWGKFFNAGQTCIAPDYLLVDRSIKDKLVEALKSEITKAYGTNPIASKDYARISHKGNFDRVSDLLEGCQIISGGQTDESQLYIEPTLIDEPEKSSKIMEGEIFGPLLPIISYTTNADIERYITAYPKPLALYVFSENNSFKNKMLNTYSFGGGASNDTVIHFVNKHLPFGGIGQSGMGNYHGKRSFTTFSHQKSIVHRGTWLDIPLRYAPYSKKIKWIQRLLKWL